MKDLTPVGDFQYMWSYATAINASGQVVGNWSAVDTFGGYFGGAFRTAPNNTINPATDNLVTEGPCTVESGTYAICRATPTAINDSGQVAGSMTWRSNGPGDPQPFRTQANAPIKSPEDAIVDWHGYPWGYDLITSGINNSGQVVGTWLNNHGGGWRTPADGSLVGYSIGQLVPP